MYLSVPAFKYEVRRLSDDIQHAMHTMDQYEARREYFMRPLYFAALQSYVDSAKELLTVQCEALPHARSTIIELIKHMEGMIASGEG